MKKSSVPLLFLSLLAIHIGHVFEEIWGRFQPLERIFGLGGFLALNWVLLVASMAVFYLTLRKVRPAYILGLIYAGLMTLNGLAHNIALAATGRYFGGFAGSVTGIPMLVLGPLLWRALWEERARVIARRRPAADGQV
jgi:hypothetical protein